MQVILQFDFVLIEGMTTSTVAMLMYYQHLNSTLKMVMVTVLMMLMTVNVLVMMAVAVVVT